MARQKYVGKAIDSPQGVASKATLTAAAANVLQEANVDSSISSAIAPYTNPAYVDQQDALRAAKSYVDQQDATKLKLSQRGVASGAVPLGADGAVPTANITTPTPLQHSMLYGLTGTATSYSNITATSTYRQLGYIDIAAPAGGLLQTQNWMPLVFGHWEAIVISGASSCPAIEVRLGGTSGQMVARGVGAHRGDYHTVTIIPYGGYIFAPVTSTQRLYFYGRLYNSGECKFTGLSSPVQPWGNGCCMVVGA